MLNDHSRSTHHYGSNYGTKAVTQVNRMRHDTLAARWLPGDRPYGWISRYCVSACSAKKRAKRFFMRGSFMSRVVGVFLVSLTRLDGSKYARAFSTVSTKGGLPARARM